MSNMRRKRKQRRVAAESRAEGAESFALSDLSWPELRTLASHAGVLRVGMGRAEVEAALAAPP